MKVSYNRPFDTRNHDPQSFLFNAEYPMIRFLEANGYNVKYWSGVDTDRFGANAAMGLTSAKKPKVFLSVGHDEYLVGRPAHERRERAQRGRQPLVHERQRGVLEDALGTGDRRLDWRVTARWSSYKETLAGSKIDPLPGVWTGTWRDMSTAAAGTDGQPSGERTDRVDLDRQLLRVRDHRAVVVLGHAPVAQHERRVTAAGPDGHAGGRLTGLRMG